MSENTSGFASSQQVKSTWVGSTAPALVYEGIGASPGTVIGRGRHIDLEYHEDMDVPLSKTSPDAVKPGDIIVLDELYLGGEEVLRKARGMIVGPTPEGVGSQSAAAARAIGIPAIITRSDPYSLIPDGELIGLDGDLGRVYRGFSSR